MANLTCIVLNCTSSSRNNEDLRFHHIPCDEERRTEWMKACKRTDLLDKPPKFFKTKYVCGLHFLKYMYKNKNLQRFATPSLHLLATSRDSCTQTWESIKILEPTPDLSELPAVPDLKKIEIRTFHAQTEEFILCAKQNLKVKKENDVTYTAIKEDNMQCEELEIESESQIREDITELTTDEIIQISTDSEQEPESGTSEMSIDKLIQLNEEFENQIREEIKIPIKNVTKSKAKRVHKRIQTDNVDIFKIPKNNQCFEQCLRCGKNASRLVPKKVKPKHLITLEDFEAACEQFLTPEFCKIVKKHIQIEQQLKRLHNKKNTEEHAPLHDVKKLNNF